MLADMLLGAGVLIGITMKLIALKNSDTVWTRKSSLLNLVFYPLTGALPYYLEQLWIAFITTTCSIIVWVGIYLYRAPENEDWLGRTNTTYTEYTRRKIRNLYKSLTTKHYT